MSVSMHKIMRGGAKREHRVMTELMRQKNNVQLERMQQTWKRFLRYLEEDMQVAIDRDRRRP